MDELETLDQLVQDHSPLISSGTLAERMAAVPETLHATPQYRFLEVVTYYDAQHRAKPADWQGARDRFLALQSESGATPFLAFYIPNYLLLSCRNAGGDIDSLEWYFEQAQVAAGQLDVLDRHRLLGFLLYNWSRCLHTAKRMDDAMDFYNGAGRHRILFYEYARDNGLDDAVVKGAATQVWKIRHDWLSFFPGTDINQCAVSEQIYDEVGKLANPSFSAKP